MQFNKRSKIRDFMHNMTTPTLTHPSFTQNKNKTQPSANSDYVGMVGLSFFFSHTIPTGSSRRVYEVCSNSSTL